MSVHPVCGGSGGGGGSEKTHGPKIMSLMHGLGFVLESWEYLGFALQSRYMMSESAPGGTSTKNRSHIKVGSNRPSSTYTTTSSQLPDAHFRRLSPSISVHPHSGGGIGGVTTRGGGDGGGGKRQVPSRTQQVGESEVSIPLGQRSQQMFEAVASHNISWIPPRPSHKLSMQHRTCASATHGSGFGAGQISGEG